MATKRKATYTPKKTLKRVETKTTKNGTQKKVTVVYRLDSCSRTKTAGKKVKEKIQEDGFRVKTTNGGKCVYKGPKRKKVRLPSGQTLSGSRKKRR